MELDATPSGLIKLKKFYAGVVLEAENGYRMNVCLRDDTFEFSIQRDTGELRRYRVNLLDCVPELVGTSIHGNDDAK